eukprot:CFRG2104T1
MNDGQKHVDEGTALLVSGENTVKRIDSIKYLQGNVSKMQAQFDRLEIEGPEREELNEIASTLTELDSIIIQNTAQSLSPPLVSVSPCGDESSTTSLRSFTNSKMASNKMESDAALLLRYWPSSRKKAFASERLLLDTTLTKHGVIWERHRPEVSVKEEGRLCKRNRNVRVNYLKIGNGPKKVVFLHGYGCSCGFWFPTLRYLAKNYPSDFTMYSLDLLGFGLSSRVSFPKKKDTLELAKMAEEFFIDELENWRLHVNIDSFQLVGHSLGGYIAGVYALKFPERIEKLHMISPAALPRRSDEALENLRSKGAAVKVVLAAYNSNITPFSVVRCTGTMGPGFIKGYANRRFTALDEMERIALTKYMYHTASLPGSGEYALKAFFLPGENGVYGVIPLGERLSQLSISRTPVTFFYGEMDWMNVTDAYDIAPNMTPKPSIYVIEGAGHNIFLDNADAFNPKLASELLHARTIHTP